MGHILNLDTTSDTHILFLDMLEIDDLHNTELVVNQATKCRANPVMSLGDIGQWDSGRASHWGGSVIFDEDEQVFKMWYSGNTSETEEFRAIGYAWSRDGIYWHKPNLGLYEFGGSEQNNIVFRSPTGSKVYGIVYPEMTGGHFTVAKDYGEEDPAKRYKGWAGIYVEGYDREGYPCSPIYSPDGLRWRLGPSPAPYPTGDATNLIFDDADSDPAKRIKTFGNRHFVNRPLGHVEMGYGPDIEHCVPSPHNPVIEPGLEHTIHLFAAVRYKRYYVVLYNYNLWLDYYGHKGDTEVRKRDSRVPEPKIGAFVGDVRLAVNRDGIGKFQKVDPHRPIVARGEKGQWDSGFLVTSAPLVHDNKIYIFYSALDESGGAKPNTLFRVPAPTRDGLATLRLDGFTNLQSRDGLAPAVVTTMPIAVRNPKEAMLILNATQLIPYRDWIEVEILDAGTNSPLEGYRREDCTDVISEGVRIPIEWGEIRTLHGIAAAEVKLRFYLYGRARLCLYVHPVAPPLTIAEATTELRES